jgi:LPS-assembly lipoprotein
MWSSSRRSLIVALALLGAGCGFRPVYGPAGAARDLAGSIEIAAPKDAESFQLVARLEQRLGRAETAAYRLDYQINLTENGVGITPEQETTRYHVVGRILYTLTDVASAAVVASGDVTNFTAYSATGAVPATIAARRDARERLLAALADQIVDRLLVTAADWRR